MFEFYDVDNEIYADLINKEALLNLINKASPAFYKT